MGYNPVTKSERGEDMAILKGRQAIAEEYKIAKRTVTYWLNKKGMPHTTEPDENGNPIPVIDTDIVERWLISLIKNRNNDLVLAGKGG